MAHKTLIGGTGYDIKGGRTLIGGTGYDIGFFPPVQRVGGRIFYIHSDNGVQYRFFTQNMTEITDISVDGLENAYWYWRSDTPYDDRFYVYDNVIGLVTQKTWGKSGINCGMQSDGIGMGKINTAVMMGLSPDGTMWTWLRDEINANAVGGCSDWFIASKAEQEELRSSWLERWYSDYYIWSSVEYIGYPYNSAYYWDHEERRWDHRGKTYAGRALAIRAF